VTARLRRRSRRELLGWALLAAAGVVVPLAAMVGLWALLAILRGLTRAVAAVVGLDQHPVAALWVVLAGLALVAGAALLGLRRRGLLRLPAVLTASPSDPGEPVLDGERPSPASSPSVPPWGRALAWAGTVAGVWWVVFSPLLGRLTTSWYGPGDANQYIWFGWRFGQAFRSGELVPTVFGDVVVPAGLDVLTLDGVLPLYVLGLVNLVLEPIPAYNVFLLGVAALNVWAGARLATVVTPYLAVQLAAGGALATAPALIWRYSGHLGMSCLFASALLAAEGLLVVRDRQAPPPWRLGLLVSVAALTSAYHLLMGGLAFVICVVFAIRRDQARDVAWRVGAALAGAAVVLLPFVVVRLAFERAEVRAGRSGLFEAWLVNFRSSFTSDALGLWPPPNVLVGSEVPGLIDRIDYLVPEGYLYPGLVALVALGGLVVVRSPYRGPLLTLAVASWLASLGTVPHVRGDPLRLLGQHVEWGPFTLLGFGPAGDSLRVPGRMALGVTLAAVAAVAVVGHEVWRAVRRPPLRVAMVGLFALTLSMNRVDTTVVTDFVDEPSRAALGAMAAAGDGAMLVVPADCDGIEVEYLLLQVYAEVPMVGCTAPHLSLPWFSELDPYVRSRGLAALRCRSSALGPFRTTTWPDGVPLGQADVERLHDELGIRWLVVDHSRLAAPQCVTLREQGMEVLSDRPRSMPGERWEIVDLGPIDTELAAAP